MGRLVKRKLLENALTAFAQVRHRLSNGTVMTIVGDGPERTQLEAMAAELGIAKEVEFRGAMADGDELRTIFHESIASVGPGQVGLSILHSFAYGVPIIVPRAGVFRGPEIENVIEGVNGLMYDGGVEGLAKCLVRLDADRAMARRLGASAYEHYTKRRTIELMAERAATCLEAVARERV
ncbi:MAG: glycosyltransferase [Bauldia sp.]|nr:glycosyltransferase [Bauldia sp.]